MGTSDGASSSGAGGRGAGAGRRTRAGCREERAHARGRLPGTLIQPARGARARARAVATPAPDAACSSSTARFGPPFLGGGREGDAQEGGRGRGEGRPTPGGEHAHAWLELSRDGIGTESDTSMPRRASSGCWWAPASASSPRQQFSNAHVRCADRPARVMFSLPRACTCPAGYTTPWEDRARAARGAPRTRRHPRRRRPRRGWASPPTARRR